MKETIDGRVYNTETNRVVFRVSNSHIRHDHGELMEVTCYNKVRTREYFFLLYGGYRTPWSEVYEGVAIPRQWIAVCPEGLRKNIRLKMRLGEEITFEWIMERLGLYGIAPGGVWDVRYR